MTTSVECPHVENGRADCPGCTIQEDDGKRCDGEVEGDVIQDSDGDASIPYGIRHFLRIEDMQATCKCVLNDAEQTKVGDDMTSNVAIYEPDASDDPQFPY